MKNHFVKIAFLVWILFLTKGGNLIAQTNWQVSSGHSISEYLFKNNAGNVLPYFQSGTGMYFQIGAVSSLFDSSSLGTGAEERIEFKQSNPLLAKMMNNVLLEGNVVANQLNASGNLINISSFDYQTQFIGLKAGIGYRFVSFNNWQIIGKAIASGQKILWGKQYLSSTQEYFDLTQKAIYPEFNNLLIHYGWEVVLKKQVNKQMGIFIGFSKTNTNHSPVTKNGTQYTLDFRNQILQFGLSLNP